ATAAASPLLSASITRFHTSSIARLTAAVFPGDATCALAMKGGAASATNTVSISSLFRMPPPVYGLRAGAEPNDISSAREPCNRSQCYPFREEPLQLRVRNEPSMNNLPWNSVGEGMDSCWSGSRPESELLAAFPSSQARFQV